MRTRALATIAVLTALLGAASAVAQDSSGILSSELEKTANTTPDEKISYAASANAEIAEAYQTVTDLLERAKEADSSTIQCVTARQASIKALQAVSHRAEQDMLDAINDRNTEKENHEFRKIAVAVSRTRMLLAEAERCLGGEQLTDGIVNIDLQIENDVSIIEDEGIDIGYADDYFGDPPDVSPFR